MMIYLNFEFGSRLANRLWFDLYLKRRMVLIASPIQVIKRKQSH